MIDAGEAEIVLARSLLVAIEQHHALAAFARLAEIAGLLAAGDEGGAVSERTVLHRHGTVVFLDTALHLGKKLLLQRFRIRHRRLHIGVLGLQMRADLGIEDGGVLEHLLPVVGPEPGIIVGARHAVASVAQRLLARDRRDGQAGKDGGLVGQGDLRGFDDVVPEGKNSSCR